MAIDPSDGELKKWSGPHIEAPTWKMAQEWCNEHAGHLVVDGRITTLPATKVQAAIDLYITANN